MRSSVPLAQTLMHMKGAFLYCFKLGLEQFGWNSVRVCWWQLVRVWRVIDHTRTDRHFLPTSRASFLPTSRANYTICAIKTTTKN